tara:strand:- start:752 stop:1780 length:1029 start_codon:yes stop_codon:yes gene_type:complete
MAITSWAAAGGDWNDAQYQRAWDGPAIQPDSALLSLFPSWAANSNTWATETEDWEQGLEPSLKLGIKRTIPNANLEIVQSYEWNQLTSSWINTVGDWNSGPIPQVAVGTGISVDKADLTFTAYSPDIGRMYNFVISAPTLTLTGYAPTDGTGFVITPDNATLTILQTYNWNNYGGTWAASSDNWDVAPFVPTAVETAQNQPDAGSLTLAGSSPDFRLSQLWYIPSASMALTGFLPVSTSGHVFLPAKADLTGLGFTSWENTSGDWASSVDNWGEGVTLPDWAGITGDWESSKDTWAEGSLIPIVGVTYIFSIDSAGNLVFTPYEPRWPLVGDPNYISEVIIS